MGTTGSTQDKILLERLRDALLSKDRQSVAEVKHIVESKEELSKRINPIITAHMKELEENFPAPYIEVVQKIVDQRMRQKQDELINILYPRLGLLIRKYINNEFRLLRERLDQVLKESYSYLRFWKRKTADEIIIDLRPSIVEEVYIISHESGLLLGSASSTETADKDMIAGMLTAIKAFVEDAFKRTDEELRGIQYGNYEIMVHNFFNYYIALAIAGTISEQERDELAEKILAFAARELNHDLQQPEPAFYAHMQKELDAYFIKPYKALPQ
ncbi:hypothetical protein [Lewinella cohaerens]|uniref:hypothetical protein n=1 Tax=Lewinella cohaerens TaxID=70995 RepID=UPI000372F828|nr:hypothetical protein [Lewinella cohaerens]